jgi:hypothetical protein
MKKCCDSIELLEFPSAQHGTGDDAADGVHPGHSSKRFVDSQSHVFAGSL